ncbi:hypothetical protein [Fimbriiglobus ruber]|nr:hypothetical protein [Fimbriiglobus ruber]
MPLKAGQVMDLLSLFLLKIALEVATNGGCVPADVPEAPMPHPPIDRVAQLYCRLGYPVPPRNAELMSIRVMKETRFFPPITQGSEPHVLGLRLPAVLPYEKPTYLLGTKIYKFHEFDPEHVTPVSPDADISLQEYLLGPYDYLYLAIQCELLTWDTLARKLYANAREGERRPILEEMIFYASKPWHDRLSEPRSDRKEILRHLKRLHAEDVIFPLRKYDDLQGYRRRYDEEIIRQLEATVVPRKSTPGSVEGLIDDLTEYRSKEMYINKCTIDQDATAYWKLVEHGFDAVPALLEHIDDERLSRTSFASFYGMFPIRLQVKHFASRLLNDLFSNDTNIWPGEGSLANVAELKKQWATIRTVGEEKWLLSHAVPPEYPKVRSGFRTEPYIAIARVIRVKYPSKLPDIYRTLLQRKSVSSECYAAEITASNLPVAQKIALLEEGASCRNDYHAFHALLALARLDKKVFEKHLALKLNVLLARGEAEGVSDFLFPVVLIVAAQERSHWDNLIAVAKKMSVDRRIWLMREVGVSLSESAARQFMRPELAPDYDNDLTRLNRLRFLMQFIDDRSPEVNKDSTCEVRDFATQYLAILLGFLDTEMEVFVGDCGFWTRLAVRSVVYKVAGQELARPTK